MCETKVERRGRVFLGINESDPMLQAMSDVKDGFRRRQRTV